MRYFFYGSLTDPDVLAVVLGRRPRRSPAVLADWRATRVAGERYPMIVPHEGAQTPGAVADLGPADARRLAWYEGDDYVPTELVVRLVGGAPTAAQVFLPKPHLVDAGEPWDAAAWAREDKPALLAAARRWMAFEGRKPANLDAAWRAAKASARR